MSLWSGVVALVSLWFHECGVERCRACIAICRAGVAVVSAGYHVVSHMVSHAAWVRYSRRSGCVGCCQGAGTQGAREAHGKAASYSESDAHGNRYYFTSRYICVSTNWHVGDVYILIIVK